MSLAFTTGACLLVLLLSYFYYFNEIVSLKIVTRGNGYLVAVNECTAFQQLHKSQWIGGQMNVLSLGQNVKEYDN